MHRDPENTDPIEAILQEYVHELTRELVLQSWQPGQVLFYSGHSPIGVYVIESGAISLEYPDKPDSIVEVLPRNFHLLGLDFVLSDSPYPFTAKAVSPVRAWLINRKRIVDVFEGK